ncbi:MAG: hypothetical protein Q8Q63_04750 [Phaeovulum sp.]|uniref:hypothetical protein n=1 Tax=Phaeovulum sp. TaxID=2934796 RepID=UPI002731C45F|nr:hypothetical protein [Phaeovulum sp.]MDP2062979.1 hypothetical protein [Phaeovulum sp.]MDP3860875.1 hypothetical protein [Phaeovulum sp.]
MSRYQELREAFAAYKDAENRFCRENDLLAGLIVGGLPAYLGMPESFTSETEVIRYLSYYRVEKDEEDAEGGEVPFLHDAVIHVTDGSFRFGLGILLEREAGVLPKQNMVVTIHCRRLGSKATVTIGDREVECQFDGSACPDAEKVQAALYELLRGWLARRPGEDTASRKIGFRLMK